MGSLGLQWRRLVATTWWPAVVSGGGDFRPPKSGDGAEMRKKRVERF
ncbi:hypothetical protein COLO4_20919 [Corchorus olitorius]|uniref:Uncharacterized protein n=1 Tax=Corchorus olitorius TaxID=93759 RepID=A0A1R3IW57_9ROSI|nr:hypothetical protein COLO4_20919 [Corchorus olitorius]